jgi:hypothetical protein
MNKREIFGIVYAIVLTMVTSQSLQAKDVPMTKPGLRCEVRGNDGFPMLFGEGAPNNIHFIVFSDQNDVKVFAESNSWGHEMRLFSATGKNNKLEHYTIERRGRVWKKNLPGVHVLNKGEFLITDINLCDGSWLVTPKLPSNSATMLMLTPRFQIDPVSDEIQKGVWSGRVEGLPREVSLDVSCVNRLNSDQ